MGGPGHLVLEQDAPAQSQHKAAGGGPVVHQTWPGVRPPIKSYMTAPFLRKPVELVPHALVDGSGASA